MKRVVELTLRLADGIATEAECRELERLTESDRRARRAHLEMMEIEAALRAARLDGDEADRSLVEERTVNAVLDGVRHLAPPRAPAPRFAARPIWAALGLASLAACLALTSWPRAAQRHTVAQPSAFARSRSPHELSPLVRGVRPVGWSAAPMRIRPSLIGEVSRLELDDGAALEIRGGALLRGIEEANDGRKRVLVDEGTVAIEVSAEHAPPAVTLVTPHAEIALRSRKALLTVVADGTRLDVHDGTATARRYFDGRTLEVGRRQTAMVTDERMSAQPLPSALVVTGAHAGRHPPDLLDGMVVRRFEVLGFSVETVDEAELRASQVEGKSLVFISPSTGDIIHERVAEMALGAAGVPIICSRPAVFPDLSMTPGEEKGRFTSNATRLTILAPSHPLAAGFSGPLQVTRAPGSLGWGLPGPGAVRVATFPDNHKNDRAVIFAYERGALMSGSVARAPARRVGFFIHPDLAPYLTEAGWALFDAAVRWTAGQEF
jgi:hypothetical protein